MDTIVFSSDFSYVEGCFSFFVQLGFNEADTFNTDLLTHITQNLHRNVWFDADSNERELISESLWNSLYNTKHKWIS